MLFDIFLSLFCSAQSLLQKQTILKVSGSEPLTIVLNITGLFPQTIQFSPVDLPEELSSPIELLLDFNQLSEDSVEEGIDESSHFIA